MSILRIIIIAEQSFNLLRDLIHFKTQNMSYGLEFLPSLHLFPVQLRRHSVLHKTFCFPSGNEAYSTFLDPTTGRDQ